MFRTATTALWDAASAVAGQVVTPVSAREVAGGLMVAFMVVSFQEMPAFTG